MIVIGGSYEDTLIDPAPVPENDSIWSFDPESGHWSRIKVKNQGQRSDSDNSQPGSDVVPWNLVHHSAFKLDSQTIGVIWYDPEILENGATRRNLMISTFNCKKCLWRNLKVAKYGAGVQSPTLDYRFFSSILPIHDEECDRVMRVLVFGGFSFEDSITAHHHLPLFQLDFTQKSELFETRESEESKETKNKTPLILKSFQED